MNFLLTSIVSLLCLTEWKISIVVSMFPWYCVPLAIGGTMCIKQVSESKASNCSPLLHRWCHRYNGHAHCHWPWHFNVIYRWTLVIIMWFWPWRRSRPSGGLGWLFHTLLLPLQPGFRRHCKLWYDAIFLSQSCIVKVASWTYMYLEKKTIVWKIIREGLKKTVKKRSGGPLGWPPPSPEAVR